MIFIGEDGKKYELVPVEEDKGVLGDYLGDKSFLETNTEPRENPAIEGSGVIRRASPRLYDYRERFKTRKLIPSDLTAPPSKSTPFRDVEYDGLVGEGTTIDFI